VILFFVYRSNASVLLHEHNIETEAKKGEKTPNPMDANLVKSAITHEDLASDWEPELRDIFPSGEKWLVALTV
jgi:hypothetical protein